MRITVNTEEMDFPCMWLDSTRLYTYVARCQAADGCAHPKGLDDWGSIRIIRVDLMAW